MARIRKGDGGDGGSDGRAAGATASRPTGRTGRVRVGTAGIGAAGTGKARVGTGRLRTARVGTGRIGTVRVGTARIRKVWDRGQVAIEYIGFLPILLLVALAAVQLGLIAYTAQQAGTAARAGARSASLAGPHEADCRSAVSSWLADGTSCPASIGGDEVTVTASVQIPSLVPGWDFGPAVKTATMPRDH